MVPLIAADATRKSGFLNLAITSVGLAAGIGATVSTTAAGWIADRAGMPAAFLFLAAAGGLAVLVLFVLMPETRPVAPRERRPRPQRQCEGTIRPVGTAAGMMIDAR